MESPPGVELVRGSVYEFHKPDRDQRIEVEIVFMHGLQVGDGDFKSAYYKTWRTRDGKEVWAATWLKEKYKNARILSLGYDSSARTTSRAGNMTPFTLSESLLEDMVSSEANIGQNRCPVIFVCHSLGGLIAKEIAVRCGTKRSEDQKYEKLLRNIKAFFFYATPHHGSDLADLNKIVQNFPGVNTSTLVEYLKPNGTDRSHTQDAFSKTLDDRDCKFYVVAEGQMTKLSAILKSKWVVRENSARFPGHSDYYMLQHADHMTVCKPENDEDGGYQRLISCIDDVVMEYFNRVEVSLSVNPIGIEGKRAEIQAGCGALGVLVIGLFGMGGTGKTTLSRKFYNDNARHYFKSCYLENVASKTHKKVQKELLQGLCGEKVDRVEKHHLDMIKECLMKERVLVVIDDVASKDYLEELQVVHALETGSDWKSKVIVTGRDMGILPKRHVKKKESGWKGKAIIVELDGINDGKGADMELFSQHAFAALGEETRNLNVKGKFHAKAKEIVKLCNGLPLSLEVIGKYLGDEYEEDLDRWMVKWNEAYDRLHQAKSIDGTENDKLWARLRISYDALGGDEKRMFLEFACILSELRCVDKKICERIWGSVTGVEHLLNRHLLKIRESWYDGEEIFMHDQLRDMGRMIGGEDSKDGPSVYLWETHKIIARCESDKNNKSFTKVLGLSFADTRKQTYSSQETSVQSSCDYSQLRLLALRNCHTPLLHDCLSKCSTELRLLHLDNSRFARIGMHNLCSFQGLRVLWIENDDMAEIPAGIGNLINLVVMKLKCCSKLLSLPDTIGNLKKLEELEIIYCNKLRTIPDAVGDLSALKSLGFVRCPSLLSLPDTVSNLKNLNCIRGFMLGEEGRMIKTVSFPSFYKKFLDGLDLMHR